MLLIGDSQLREVTPQKDEVIICKPGYRARNAAKLLLSTDLRLFDSVVVWVGGNGATPKYDRYNHYRVKNSFDAIIGNIQSKSDAKIVLVSATPKDNIFCLLDI